MENNNIKEMCHYKIIKKFLSNKENDYESTYIHIHNKLIAYNENHIKAYIFSNFKEDIYTMYDISIKENEITVHTINYSINHDIIKTEEYIFDINKKINPNNIILCLSNKISHTILSLQKAGYIINNPAIFMAMFDKSTDLLKYETISKEHLITSQKCKQKRLEKK